MPTPPTEIPRWATDGGATVTTPTSGKQDSGWVGTEKPPAGTFNWLGKWTYLWIVYARDAITELLALLAGKLAANGSISWTGSQKPATTNTIDLGDSSHRFRKAYVVDADVSGNLGVTGGTILAGNLQTVGAALFSGDVTAAAALGVSGAVTFADSVTSTAGFTPSDSDSKATATPTNTLRKRLVPKAWGVVKSVSGVPLLVEGANMASPALSGELMRVNFATPMANADYAVAVSTLSGVAWVQPNGKSTTHFFLAPYDIGGPTAGVVGFATDDITVDFIVFGVQ